MTLKWFNLKTIKCLFTSYIRIAGFSFLKNFVVIVVVIFPNAAKSVTSPDLQLHDEAHVINPLFEEGRTISEGTDRGKEGVEIKFYDSFPSCFCC